MEQTTVFDLLGQAGWTMVPLYLCSILALAVAVRKGIQFQLDRVTDPSGDGDSPLARVLGVARSSLEEGGPAVAEGEAMRAAVHELDHYEAWLPLLGFIAQVAPLFGLLGTVLGMVDLFSGMETAGNDVSTATLSAGIWKALLTTAAGLIIAIPTLGAHLWFTRRLELLQHRMEQAVGRLLAGASRAAA